MKPGLKDGFHAHCRIAFADQNVGRMNGAFNSMSIRLNITQSTEEFICAREFVPMNEERLAVIRNRVDKLEQQRFWRDGGVPECHRVAAGNGMHGYRSRDPKSDFHCFIANRKLSENIN
ncbi:hypothetical protein [Burkholderia sp. 22PA0106]|uniref:hypothetical protein n=1 Tax=Burkholderia sp. 22PA0106 TaxID=3237371 RepID=UPI0039C0FBED